MSSLSQTVSQSQAGYKQVTIRSPGDKRLGGDRRMRERRQGVPFYERRQTRLRFAAQAASFGTYDLDCVTGDSIWSPDLSAMAGLPKLKTPLTTEQVEALIHPEDRSRFLQKLYDSLDPKGTGEFEDEHRLIRTDGSICWVKIQGRTLFVAEGEDRLP